MYSQGIRQRRDDGASAVEFALVLLLLMLLLTGIIQFGWTFFQYLQVEHAAREGARWASLRTDGGSVSQAGTTRHYASEAAPSLDPRLTDAQIAISVDGENRDTAVAGDESVMVTVTYESPVLMPFISNLIGGGDTIPLNGAAEMRVE